MIPWQKIIFVAALFFYWSALVLWAGAPVEQLIQVIREALVALGVFHATIFNPKE